MTIFEQQANYEYLSNALKQLTIGDDLRDNTSYQLGYVMSLLAEIMAHDNKAKKMVIKHFGN